MHPTHFPASVQQEMCYYRGVMSLNPNGIKHNCNIIRRQIQAEFPDLHLCYLPYTENGKSKAIDQEENIITTHVAGSAALKHLRRHKRDKNTGFIGIVEGTKKSFLNFRNKTLYMALIFIDTGAFEYIEDLREHAYHQAWHAISLYQHIKKDNKRKITREEELYIPRYENLDKLSHNMSADSFTAVILDLQHEQGVIKKIARRRAEATVKSAIGAAPELYPFPIAFEATRLVYDDLKDLYVPSKNNAVGLALQMSHEVEITHPENTLKQWRVFSAHAQEMAWIGYTKEQILSAGCYTSEDPYVRTTAYIIAEILEIEPKPWNDFKIYNPFTEEEMNERSHSKACDHVFKNVCNHIMTLDDTSPFHNEAAKRNQALLKGYVLGWCVQALLDAAEAFSCETLENAKEKASEAFQNAKKKVAWPVLTAFSKQIMLARRDGKIMNRETIQALAEKNVDFQIILEMFDAAPPVERKHAASDKNKQEAV